MRRIKLHCRKTKEAEQKQQQLYTQYNNVKLVQFPMFGESGTYIWEVSEPIVNNKTESDEQI